MAQSALTGGAQDDITPSRLGASLLRLHRAVEESVQQQARFEALLEVWQSRWDANRERISQKLKVLHERLDALHQEPRPPKFAIVAESIASETAHAE